LKIEPYIKDKVEIIGGSEMDISVFLSIFNIKLFIIKAVSKEVANDKYDESFFKHRLWTLCLYKIERMRCLSDMSNNANKKVTYHFVCYSEQNGFQKLGSLNQDKNKLSNSKTMQLLFPTIIASTHDDIMNEANNWIKYREDKQYNCYDGWCVEELVESLTTMESIMPVLRMIDPIKSIHRKRFDNKKYVWATNLFTFQEIHSMMPDTKVVNKMLDLFYESIEAKYKRSPSIICIGPVKCQLFKRINKNIAMDDKTLKDPAEGLQSLLSQASSCKKLIIQMNTVRESFECDTKGHYIIIEIDIDEAKQNQEFKLLIADSCDDDILDESKIVEWKHIVMMQKLDVFLELIRPAYKISYHRADNVTLQHDMSECGIHGARRIDSLFKFGPILHQEAIERQIGTTRNFRLFIIETIFLSSREVSLYVCQNGTCQSEISFSNLQKSVPSPIKKILS
jgi:hypothetical protein